MSYTDLTPYIYHWQSVQSNSVLKDLLILVMFEHSKKPTECLKMKPTLTLAQLVLVVADSSQAEQSASNIAAEFHETTNTESNQGKSRPLNILYYLS